MDQPKVDDEGNQHSLPNQLPDPKDSLMEKIAEEITLREAFDKLKAEPNKPEHKKLRAVYNELTKGIPDNDIARRLNIHRNTVRNRRKKIRELILTFVPEQEIQDILKHPPLACS